MYVILCSAIRKCTYFKTSKGSCLFDCLTLPMIEIHGHADHRFADFLSKITLRCFLHLHENERADLRRSVSLSGKFAVHARVAILALYDVERKVFSNVFRLWIVKPSESANKVANCR